MRDNRVSDVVPKKKSRKGLYVTLGIIVFLIAALAVVWFADLFGVQRMILGEDTVDAGASPYTADEVLDFDHDVRFDAQGRVEQCVYEVATGITVVDFRHEGEDRCTVNTYNYDKNGELVASDSADLTIECTSWRENELYAYFVDGDSTVIQIGYYVRRPRLLSYRVRESVRLSVMTSILITT